MGVRQQLELVGCAAGIYGAYLTQGYVQEALATTTYGDDGRFPHLEALNGAQCVACFLLASFVLLLRRGSSAAGGGNKVATPWMYWRPALSNAVGPACGIVALKSINYPAQVLAKSSKAIPVMLMGTLIGGKVYSAAEYLSTALIAAGISLFAWKGSPKAAAKLAAPNAGLGYGLCAVNLILDGFTNATQDAIHAAAPGTSALHTMCYMNVWTGLYYAVYLFGPIHLLGLQPAVGYATVDFCTAHPDAALQVALFCACGAVGQVFIFHAIRTFGSLVNTLITTTRKFFNILISVLINGNPLLPQQWAAVGMVFCGLMMHSLMKPRKPKAKTA
mmetsp:Transcript_34996/g.88165  ORF Transcript_34996/g.88165 Transcript_34996/m.88165 type:complete len:332 (+) Transcript_34996:224-1219(+)